MGGGGEPGNIRLCRRPCHDELDIIAGVRFVRSATRNATSLGAWHELRDSLHRDGKIEESTRVQADLDQMIAAARITVH